MSREAYELQRTDSICPTPEAQLLDCLKTNHVPKLKSLVAENPGLVNITIGHPFDKPILHIACYEFADRVIPQTIEALIELGADLYYTDEVQNNREALHFATLGQNLNILRTIINNINPDKINSLCGGNNTALNLLIKEGDPNHSNFIDCIRLLVQSGVDVSKSDNKNLTPVFWAAKKGYREAVQIILYESGQQVDVDSHKLRGKCARDYIAENNLGGVYEVLPNNNETRNPLNTLLEYLKEYNEDAFLTFKDLPNFVDGDDGLSTLLQIACRRGLKRVVHCLLNNGADPNKTTLKDFTTPIEIAGIEGYHEIFGLLLNHETIRIPPSLLTELLKHADNELLTNDINHGLCYNLLMQYKSIDFNALDKSRSTPLHYAARYGGAEKTLDLLRAGASMACKNKYGALPVEDIDANTLETHLDECLETNVDSNIDKENFTAIFNYKTLMPPSRLRLEDWNKTACDAEAAHKLIENEIKQLASETQVISYMSKSAELKHLLKHPVITSFLYIKWHRIRYFFYANLAFYISFCLSLILYILLIYNNQKSDPNKTFAYILSAFLCITFVVLTFRELFQIAVSPKTYFFNFENWLELLLIFLTAIILFRKEDSDGEDDLRKQVAAFAILLAAFEMVLLIGQHPKMSTNIVMLRTVSTNFFKFLLWYSILIIAFALSFYTLFTNVEQKDIGNGTNNDDEEQDFFIDPGLSLFKTIVMLTGEFDAGSINFKLYPITSHIIFMLFVFMIAIILFNLLNGLAVSDTQLIKSNAELVGHIARIEHIAYTETMLLGNILPRSVLNCIQRYCCCISPRLTSKFLVPGILVKRVCLFPYFLKDYKLVTYPNQFAKIALPFSEYSDPHSESCLTQCNNIYLDKQTAKRTKQLIKIKKEIIDKEKNEQVLIEKQKELIEQQQRCIEDLKKEQQIILNKLDYIITNISVK